jgi:hypothetical protein
MENIMLKITVPIVQFFSWIISKFKPEISCKKCEIVGKNEKENSGSVSFKKHLRFVLKNNTKLHQHLFLKLVFKNIKTKKEYEYKSKDEAIVLQSEEEKEFGRFNIGHGLNLSPWMQNILENYKVDKILLVDSYDRNKGKIKTKFINKIIKEFIDHDFLLEKNHHLYEKPKLVEQDSFAEFLVNKLTK